MKKAIKIVLMLIGGLAIISLLAPCQSIKIADYIGDSDW